MAELGPGFLSSTHAAALVSAWKARGVKQDSGSRRSRVQAVARYVWLSAGFACAVRLWGGFARFFRIDGSRSSQHVVAQERVDTLQPPLALSLCSHMWLATFPALKLVRHYMRLLIAASAYGKQYTVDQIKECIVAVYTKTNASGQLNSA